MSERSSSTAFVIQNALLASRFSKKIGNRLSVHGISLTEYLVMDYLDSTPHKAVVRIELADHLGMSASGVTRLIAPMEKNKLLEKVSNPRDARQSLVKLSGVGQLVLNDAKVSFQHIADEMTDKLNDSQLKKLTELYAKVI